MTKYIFIPSILVLLSIQSFAQAEQCESNFSKEGSFFKGTTYKTWALFKNVKASKAYKKIYRYTVKDGWTITESDKDIGIISATQNVSYGQGKTVPLNIIIEEVGTAGSQISLTYSTSGGVSSPAKAVRKHFCSMLAEVRK